MNEIKFYSVNSSYGFFSNFSPHRIFIEGEMWRTVEHYFQASKFEDNTVKEKIKELESPMDAALLGRSREMKIREDWEEVKEDVMYEAVKFKFFQHLDLKKELFLTQGALIIEHTKNDSYWGDGGDGTGKNRLGAIIMKVRDEIKNYSNDINFILPPWIAFKGINQYDMFWRMGTGEDYISEWFLFLLSVDLASYKNEFIEPEDWTGIYDL
jgi:ribA/ribD-fused uncharacterized protein